jgi:small-conductance mechanosensitive channel
VAYCVFVLTVFVMAPVERLAAQETAHNPPPPQVQELIRILDDPAVRTWLDQARTAPAPGSEGFAVSAETAASTDLAARLSGVRQHLRNVATAVPQLPDEIARVSSQLMEELRGRGLFGILLLFIVFVAFGYGSEQLFWRATARTRAWIGSHPMATVPQRLRMIGLRLAFGLALVAIFAIGSIGAFLPFEWPPLLREIVLTYLLAVLIVRLVNIVGRVILVPGGRDLDDPERYRVIPMETADARYWHRRIVLFVGYLAFGWATVSLLEPLGFPPPMRSAAAYLLGLGLLAIGLEALWRRPHAATPETSHGGWGRTATGIVLTLYGIVLWILWVAGLNGLFWLGAVALLLPKTVRLGQAAVSHLLRPTEGPELSNVHRGVLEVCLERGFRTVLIVAAALWLAHAWHIDLIALTDRDTLLTRLMRGALTSVVVVLLADFLWQVIKAAVDAKIAESEIPTEPGTEEAVRQARLRTLLPIFRNILLVLIAIMAGLTALSALGVEIGPLIAGAGVAGVAVGFGAQTIVRDVISGIFYLLDDAFRVGEYIQSGSYKGTVESFSLRSVKLRHHRGPVFTVPFGQLGAVQNMSRDWVIDKFAINVTYDTDLEKARRLIKKIGQDMAADPAMSHSIIEPLKMQGVEQFGDFAIQIRCKMTTKPGEQFPIRRKAFALIKRAFDENGIKFAFPTVQVSGGNEVAAAVAHEGLQLVKPAGAAE